MKKLLTCMLVLVMLFSLCAGALTLDMAETATDTGTDDMAVAIVQ